MRLLQLLGVLTAGASVFGSSFLVTFQEPPSVASHDETGVQSATRSSTTVQLMTPGPGSSDLSEFMIGSVAVGIFLVESQGHDYDWTDSEVNQTLQGIYAGLAWWASLEPAARLSFSYEPHVRQLTTFEPIERPIHDDVLWIDEIMSDLGYLDVGVESKMSHFDNDLRVRLKTDWAYSIFVAESRDAVNFGRFTDDEYGWGYYGGPWFTMSRHSSWAYNSADYYRVVPAHETGHIFYATDEYDSDPVEYSGYLNCPDNNGATGLMNRNTLNLSASTRCQIGWRDSDGDGIFDIVDVPPETSLIPYSPNPTTDCQARYSGTATVVPLPNQNPYGPRHDVTVSRIIKVEYRVDGGPWRPADADDDAFDEYEENLTFVTPPRSAGPHVVEARAFNTEGNADPAPASDVLVTQSALCSAVDALPPYSNNTVPSISVSAVGPAAGVELWYSKEGSGYALCSLDAAPPWEWFFNTSATGGDGLYRFYSVALDGAGNREPPPALADASTRVDTVLPRLRIDRPDSSQWLGSSMVEIDWTGNDAESGIDRFTVALDSDSMMDAGLARNHTFADVVEGRHRASVIAFDRAGNHATAFVDFGVDRSAPALAVIAPERDQFVRQRVVEVAWNGTDALSGITRYEVSLDSRPFVGVGRATNHTFTDVPDGVHSVTVRAWDASGNVRDCSVTFRVDTSWIGAHWPWVVIAFVVVFVAVAILVARRRRKRPAGNS